MLVISSMMLSLVGGGFDREFENRMERGSECFLKEYRDHRYNKGFHSRHSQNSEDLLLLPTLMASVASRGRGAGLFVELGALDGMSISNTLLLEVCFNWTGVLIEANPNNYAHLKRSGRKAAKVHAAVCPAGESIIMSRGAGPKASQLDVSAWRPRENPNRTVTVPCRPLSLVMQEMLPAPHTANFLSLDVEGAEAVVLATVDPAAFDIIMVETGMGTRASVAAKDAKVDQLITAAGLHLAPAPLAVPHSRVYLKPHIIAYPIRDTRSHAAENDTTEEAPVLVRHERYNHIWRPSPRLNSSHLAAVLMKALASGRSTDEGRAPTRHRKTGSGQERSLRRSPA